MIIQPTSVAALTWLGAASGASSEAWRMGSVLSARLLGTTDQGSLVLQIGALTVETDVLDTQLPSQFQVRVLSTGAQPLLELLSAPSPPDTGIGKALLERLPQQNGYAPLLATVAAIAHWPVLRQLPSNIRTALALLEHSMVTPEDIVTPEGLRKAIEHSGLFLESHILRSSDEDADIGQSDWKGALVRLLSVLDSQAAPGKNSGTEVPPPLQSRGMTPQGRAVLPAELLETSDATDLLPRLHNDVQAALARLEVAQLEARSAPACMIEIPLHGNGGADVLQVRLEQHNQDDEQDQHWTLGFAIDLPSLGPVQGELVLRGLRLSVRLWALQSHTVAMLDELFIELRERLSSSGLILDQLSCQTGLPQQDNHRSAVFLKATA